MLRHIVVVLFTFLILSTCASARAANWKNQEEWLASSTTEDIAEMILFAAALKNGKSFDASKMECHVEQTDQSQQKYSVSIKSPELPSEFKRELKFEKCIFEIDTYTKIASGLISELKLTPEAGSFVPSTELMLRLSDNSMGAMTEQNAAVSAALTAHPLNSELHEEAALIFSTFNLLDMARSFSDDRFGVSRSMAHLAIASALRGNGEPTFCGKLGETAQYCVSSRDTEATQHAVELLKEAKTDNEKSWARCMLIMGTNDPRKFDAENFTPVEEYQYLKRIAFFEDGKKVVEYLRAHHQSPNISWMRLVSNGSLGVEEGHVFSAGWFPAEIADYARDRQIWTQKTSTDAATFSQDLNLEPTHCFLDGKLQVVSWPDVAFWHQRQLLASFSGTYDFFARSYAVPEDAAAVVAKAKKLFGNVALYPFVTSYLGKEEKTDVDGAIAIIQKAPNLVPSAVWFTMCSEDQSHRVLNFAKIWFGALPLFGTAYEFWGYEEVLESPKLNDFEEINRLRDIALYNRDVCEKWIYVKCNYPQNSPTGDQFAEGYGKMLGFDHNAIYKTAYGDWKVPAKFIARMEREASTYKPDDYFILANYCLFYNKIDQALKYFKLGMNSDADALLRVADSWWYIHYLFDHGDKAGAEKWANFGAEVYSRIGLRNRAMLFEVEGKLSDAESWLKKIVERYDNSDDLSAFYIRHMSSPSYAAKAKAAIAKYYPKGGFTKLETVSSTTPPKNGARIATAYKPAQSVGCNGGDTLVALNGYAVHDVNQAYLLSVLPINSRWRGVFWDGHKYKNFDVLKNSIEFIEFADR